MSLFCVWWLLFSWSPGTIMLLVLFYIHPDGVLRCINQTFRSSQTQEGGQRGRKRKNPSTSWCKFLVTPFYKLVMSPFCFVGDWCVTCSHFCCHIFSILLPILCNSGQRKSGKHHQEGTWWIEGVTSTAGRSQVLLSAAVCISVHIAFLLHTILVPCPLTYSDVFLLIWCTYLLSSW